jgi:hypothetical protein
LIFPANIVQGTVGNKEYRFGFDVNNPGKIGIVKGDADAVESNLLVITEDKNIYSFLLQDGNGGDVQLNHFISAEEAIGNLDGDIVFPNLQKNVQPPTKEELADLVQQKIKERDTTIVDFAKEIPETSDLYVEDRLAYYERHASNFITQERFFRRLYKNNSGVFLKVRTIDYNKNEMYFVLEIDNTSGVDYDVEFINFFISFKKASKKRAMQKDIKKPLYVYKFPKRVEGSQKAIVTFVFPKFSIDEKKLLYIELKENSGERNIILKISPNEVNFPE